jgi:molybdopterin converting factor small subunit
LIETLNDSYPGVKDRLYESGRLRRDVIAIVDGRATKLGLGQLLAEDSEVQFLPVVISG